MQKKRSSSSSKEETPRPRVPSPPRPITPVGASYLPPTPPPAVPKPMKPKKTPRKEVRRELVGDWAASLGYIGLQNPSWDARLFDLERAAESKDYRDEVKGLLGAKGLVVTELSTHLQGQLVAVHPAYDEAFDGFAAPKPPNRAGRHDH